MSSVDKEYYEYLMSQDKSDLAITIMNLEPSSSNNRIAEYIKENNQLKQQLSEKDKENLTLFSMLYETLEKQGCENITSSIEQMTNLTLEKQSDWFKENCVKDQDKILFAIAELEKVKGKIQHNILFVDGDDYLNVIEEIDNQINELKGEK